MKTKNLYDKIKGKGLVKNFSSKILWIVETDTGFPIIHLLKPLHKFPPSIDADGFKRVDSGLIRIHQGWWKIYGHIIARVYDNGNEFDFGGFGRKVKETEFNTGSEKEIPPKEDKSNDWGVRMKLITNIRVIDKNIEYYIDELGWTKKSQTIELVKNGDNDNAVIVIGRGQVYIRSWPDNIKSNNFSTLRKRQ